MLTHHAPAQEHTLLVAPLFCLFSTFQAFIGTLLSLKGSGAFFIFTSHTTNNNTYLQESREIKLHPPSTFLFLFLLLLVWLFDARYIYKTDREHAASFFFIADGARASFPSPRSEQRTKKKSRAISEKTHR